MTVRELYRMNLEWNSTVVLTINRRLHSIFVGTFGEMPLDLLNAKVSAFGDAIIYIIGGTDHEAQ